MNVSVQTDDKQAALALLTHCLESGKLVNARIQHLDGVYSVEVSEPTDECLDEPG